MTTTTTTTKQVDILGRPMERRTGSRARIGQWDREYSDATGLSGGFIGMRDKKTGEIHVPSAYYRYWYTDSKIYWDSETNTTQSKGMWIIINDQSKERIESFLKRLRKKEDDFDLVAFDLKNNAKGGVGHLNVYYSTLIYEPLPSPLPRDEVSKIRSIIVLQTSLSSSDQESKILEQDAITAIEMEMI